MTALRRAAHVVTALLVATASLGVGAAPQGSRPTFRTDTNLVAVDVMVVGGDGQPMLGLRPDQFDVRIDGRRRRVSTAELIQYPLAAATAGRAETAQVSGTNGVSSDVSPARSFVLAVDVTSLEPGETVYLQRAARSFVDRLADTDLVGLVALPHGAVVRPTADRVAVRRAIETLVGGRSLMAGAFNLSAAEAVDISADDGPTAASPPVTARGAVAPVDLNDVLRQVATRECRASGDSLCLAAVRAEAEALSRLYDEQAAQSIAGLQRLVALLGEYPTRRTVVLVSGGMPVSDRQGSWFSDGGLVRSLARSAAQANATVFVLHVGRVASEAGGSAQARTVRRNGARERELNERLLQEMAVKTGGARLSAPTGSPSLLFDRLLAQTTAVYLLGVVPEPRDLDGRTHALSVRVGVRGADVRSRMFVLLRSPGTDPGGR